MGVWVLGVVCGVRGVRGGCGWPSVGQAWAKRGPSMGQAWAEREPSVGRAWAERGPSVGQAWAERVGQAWFLQVRGEA